MADEDLDAPGCERCRTPLRIVRAEMREFETHICLRVAWRAWHTEACCANLEDPGARCICRPPATDNHAIGFGR